MSTVNGTVTGVTLVSGNPAGPVATVSSTKYNRKSYLCTVDFPAYTGSTDTMTITGINTAIKSATRNGRSLTLIAVVPAFAGQDANAQAVFAVGSSSQIPTLSNTTTTGDAAGNLGDAGATEVTSTSGTTVGVGIICVVDETL